MNNKTQIENHMKRLATGYKLWCVPLLMVMWDIGFKTGGGNTVEAVFKNLITKPYFMVVAAWTIILSLAMDHRGKLALNTLTDTSQPDVIGYIMREHSIFAMLLTLTPVIFITAKGLWMYYYLGEISISLFADIHLAITLIAMYDGVKAIRGNNMIKKELE